MIRIRLIRNESDARQFLTTELDELSRFSKRQTVVVCREDDRDAAAVFSDYEGWLVGTASPDTSIPGKHFLIKSQFPARSRHL